MLWAVSDLLTLYLLVSTFALDPMVAGCVFLAGLAANGLADLGVGIWLGHHPQHAAPIAGCGLALAALAFPATVLLAPYGGGALLAATLVFRIAYSGCDVPHNALLARLGSDPVRAIRLSRGRTVGTALASLLAIGVAGDRETIAMVPLLWGVAASAFMIGSTMVPLLIAHPLPSRAIDRPGTGGAWLPLPFLIASVIGIVALGALGKAVLHLPASWPRADGSTILALLIAGRTASALIPMRFVSPRRGLALLVTSYAGSAMIALACAYRTGLLQLLLLGLAMGATNLIGWALLPALAVGPRGYGLYTMASKLALGAAGLALAEGLGRVPAFTSGGFIVFALAVAAACGTAAMLASLGLTAASSDGFSS